MAESVPLGTQPGPIPLQSPPKEQAEKLTKKRAAKTERPKPTKTLPTDRVAPAKQLDLLRAYAAASNLGTKAATVNEIADLVKVVPSTVMMCNPFFLSIGLLSRTDAGTYSPSTEVIAFLRAYEWNQETASQKLAGPMKDAWFGQALMARITFKPIDEEEAITALAEVCNASREYRNQLRIILELLALCGVIQRDNGQVRLVRNTDQTVTTAAEAVRATAAEPEPRTGVDTAFSGSEGGVTFSVNVSVDMREFGTWRPERIAAFFSGIAQVLAAKANVERGGSS